VLSSMLPAERPVVSLRESGATASSARESGRPFRVPDVPKEKLPQVLFRIHRVDREPEWFSAGLGDDAGRWDPPVNSAEAFGTCYTSTAPLGAYLDVFAELPLGTQADIDRRALAVIQLPPERRWADMTNTAIVCAWHLDERISTGDDYSTCHFWAHSSSLRASRASTTTRSRSRTTSCRRTWSDLILHRFR